MKKRYISTLLAVCLLITSVCVPLPTKAASSSEIRSQINVLKAEQKKIKEQIAEVEEQYEETEDEIADIVEQKCIVDQQIQLLSDQIDNINAQISDYNTLIADKQDELTLAEERYDQLNEESSIRVRAMEEAGKISYWEVVMESRSFSDLLDRITIIDEIADADERRLEELDKAAKDVAEAKSVLETEKEEFKNTKQELDDAQAEMTAKREESEALIQELLTKCDDLEALKAEYEEKEQNFLDEIAKKEDQFDEAKRREWEAYMATYVTTAPSETKPSGGTGSGSSSSAPSSSGWIAPCSYTSITSAFGYRKAPTAGASTYHQGVDLAAPTGTPIYASRSGTVSAATYSYDCGYYVQINHGDGYRSIYMHMTHYVVSAGQHVSQGQVIGYCGSTGISTGPHLHFGISKNGVYVNPANYIPI